jgi:hypothetical protein
MTTQIMSDIPDFMLSKDSVYSLYRVYIIFTAQKIPLWTPLLRLGLRYYQGTKVTYTHSLVALVDLQQEAIFWYEMDFSRGMAVYQSEYDTVHYEGNALTVGYDTFYGGSEEKTYTAVDVTTDVTNSELNERWTAYLTDERLTPWSLLKHLTPANPNKITWTCSGLTEALLTGDAYRCYISPKSPDQLLYTLTH